MCGIVGYVGARNAVDVLIAGLSHLEYRGYDSVGLAVATDTDFSTVKVLGRVANIIEPSRSVQSLQPCVGIAHTRWATHGKPTQQNAHPHRGKLVTLVHNGIIENYQSIKQELISEGYQFESETDTEVAAKLLDSMYSTIKHPLQTIQAFLKRIEGSYAIAVMFVDVPNTIYAIRKGSPLLIGIGNQEYFIASDMTPILDYTRDFVLLDESSIAMISSNKLEIFDAGSGEEMQFDVQHASWNIDEVGLQGEKFYMMKEIIEQPSVVRRSLQNRIQDGFASFEADGIDDLFFEDIETIHIVACGTAMHAGLVGKHWIETLARKSVNVDVASEFRYRNPILNPQDLVIVVSQSGETADTLACLSLAKSKNIRTLGIVNVDGSSIARDVDALILTKAGIERSVASTKAYMSQITCFYLLAHKLSQTSINMTDVNTMLDAMDTMIQHRNDIEAIVQPYINLNSAFYVGRGLDSALAVEGSLKLKEITYIHSEAYAAGELKHGSIALIDDQILTVAVATQSHLIEKTISNIQEIKARDGQILCVIMEKEAYRLDPEDSIITIPNVPALVAPFVAIIPLQVIAYMISDLKGLDVDKPRNLAKSVTVE
ncbi:glutamine--fructose-6-phosphate transaminase (isomerizing) [Erysipelothrix sp. HDW6B]|uniref:glutamine--fructose-6-phosphate transaminase (isomerizing) n=1 Tax=Erysipelothrix sp. HDW6B TaxID=2714929 RepID=UPI00140AF29F|nr:glutamine--fructose-6-phosphate transaminase (isomerizing) [Erysipelothrix sp. HDW6B]QIK86025.1 glutamine--fructose-6-phosphate transaminase (isomerizing) [Erysipelothrix sp. HDW6B]